MILGIYLKSKPKSKWHLVSVSTSAEHANQEVNLFKEQATLNGYDEAEVAIQSFESSFWISFKCFFKTKISYAGGRD